MSETMSGPPSMHGDKTKARLLAVLMHVLFFVLIVVGVSWQRKPQPAVEAELWSKLPPMPKVAPKVVERPPEKEPAPRPKPPPAPKVMPAPPKVEPPPAPKPDIAVKQKVEKKVEPKPPPKPDLARIEVQKRAAAKKAAEERARREEREREMQKLLAEKEAAAKLQAERAAAERKARAAEASEMAKYVAGIQAKVWARVALPQDLVGNPEAVFVVSLLPGGELQSVTMSKSSGNAAYDAAIERAIRQAQPFVVPTGDAFHRNFRRFPMTFRPRN
jgi:colicin import membrane protein